MVAWAPFTHRGTVYDLSHLHPRLIEVVQPASGDKPAVTYRVQLGYGLHTFTRGVKAGETPNQELLYRDRRECRIFDFDRYRLSFQLPDITSGLHLRKCYHTGKGNFFVVEAVGVDGVPVEYEVYFEASRASQRGVLNLFVQSAYVRDDAHKGGQPKRKPIKFYVLMHNIQANKPIKVPK